MAQMRKHDPDQIQNDQNIYPQEDETSVIIGVQVMMLTFGVSGIAAYDPSRCDEPSDSLYCS